MRAFVLMAVLAAGCGKDMRTSDEVGEAAKPPLAIEAERVCAGLTGYSPEAMAGKPATTQALFRREFDLCVASASRVDPPGLRGKSEAP